MREEGGEGEGGEVEGGEEGEREEREKRKRGSTKAIIEVSLGIIWGLTRTIDPLGGVVVHTDCSFSTKIHTGLKKKY
jgi:hypothetical protein